jgi:CRP-like cAMP-binding protein
MAVITSQPRMAGLVARGDVRVLSIARPQFESILRERPETALGVIRVLCQRLAEPARSALPVDADDLHRSSDALE